MKLERFKLLLKFLWTKDNKIRKSILLSLVLGIIAILLNIITPIIFKSVINSLSNITAKPTYFIYIILVTYGLTWLIGQITSEFKSILIFKALERGSRNLSLQIFDKLHSLSLRFHIEKKTGAIISSIERAQFGLDSIFWGIFLYIIPTLIEIILVISVLTFFYGIYYSIILLFLIILYLLFSLFSIERFTKKQEVYNQKRSQASARMIDSLINFETVKYFNNQKFDRSESDKFLQEQESAGVKKYYSYSLIQLGQNIIIGISLLLVTIFSGRAVINNQINIGDFVLINSYILQFAMPLHHIGHILRQVRNGLNDMDEIFNLFEKENEIKDSPNAIDIKISSHSINFENISFSYNKEREILHNLSFSIPSGKTIAIVGPTGSGKSTITKILFRFYDVTTGSILINNNNIKNITQNSLHQLIGVVPQETVLFNNTIYYNIAYGKPGATQEEIEMAAQKAHLKKFIQSLPEGYNTIVGERGLKLSGGEKQRIAIARVILKQPSIYIFDEATSSLDSVTEKEIQRNIEEISQSATTLIIAHRLSTIIHADKIIVLNDGQISEYGTHHELLQLNGIYKNLWNKQQNQ
ncbi:ATP-binding cassette domain-containing protein [Candidatus Dependentiae bacterium]|nr:ATP-binding cassette domain-containing protein [Candidatus Dependentiae bacterium]MBU4387494.1 ATP-binding cassette domain-containing protein [Candidatus Dependentiae bacterium]MCG2756449.1 ATP-binding cassette domain-containing protein [Candidatus Dependentiae bacterium]